MDNRVRVIKLVPVSQPSESVSFEDAFGEFSEARGRGRARRKKRKLERISNRKEVRSARQQARADLQQERIARRKAAQQARQEKRTSAGETRQQRRTGRVLARQERKNLRTQGQIDREAMLQEAELAAQEQDLDTSVEQDMGYTPEETGGYAPEETGGYVPEETGGYFPEETGGYAPEETGVYAPETGFGTEDFGTYNPTYTNSETPYEYGNEEIIPDAVGSEGTYSEEGDYIGGGDYLGELSDVEMPFDGVMGAEDRFSEFTDSNIDPKIQDTVNKLVWNQELISRLEAKRNSLGGDKKQLISKKIIERKKRANELQSQLDGYCNVEGEYSGADGQKIAGKRRADIARARGIAMRSRLRKRVNQPLTTPVESELNPRISPNKIVIPGQSSFTGLNGLDLENDFDAPRVREIMLGVDGSKGSTISWTSVAIGLAVGVASIWAIKKFKLIK
jgi:hypothetical protein